MDTASPLPAGLHVHLVPAGPTARFAVWLEAYPDPHAYQRSISERWPAQHPGCPESPERPAFIPKGTPRASFNVRVPTISNGNPIPLPGPMLGWNLNSFSARGRNIGERTITVTGWLIPPALSLGPLRRLLLGWRARYGAGFVAPAAPAVVAFIDEALALLREGPLLPTLDLPATATGDAVSAWATGPRPEQPLAWVPPVSLDQLDRLAAGLAAAPRLWAAERGLLRFARFAVEILGVPR